MKKLIAMLLVLCMLLLGAACSKKNDSNTPGSGTTPADTGTGDPYLDSLPKRDYGGEEFYVLCTTQTAPFYDITEEEGGNNVSAAVFSRNNAVADRYHVTIRHKQLDGNMTGSVAFATEIRTSILADKGYDLIVGQNYYCLPAAVEGNLQDLAASSYLHWDESWYSQKINDNAVVNGKIFGASGTYIMSQITYAMATFYNKELWLQSGFTDDLYQLVRDKEWTFEKLNEFVTGQFQDINHNENIDEGDRFGYVYHQHGVAASIAAAGLPITTKDDEGNLTVLNYYTDRLVQVFESYYAFYNDGIDAFKVSDDFGPAVVLGAGQTLFANVQLSALTDCSELKNSEFHVGVLPMPMYDTTQSDYVTYTQRWELFYVPSNADFERSTIVLEYLNYTTEQLVVPAYWEKALNKRAADAPQDSEMMYIVKDGLWYDFVTFYNHVIPLRDAVASLINNRNSRIANWWKSNKDTYQTQLEKVLEDYGTAKQ